MLSQTSSSSTFNVRFFHASTGRTTPPNQAPPLIPVLRHLRLEMSGFQIMLDTFLPCLPTPTFALCPSHLIPSACGNPVLFLFSLNMSKPS